MKENLKNERCYKQTNRPLAVILAGLYLAVSVFFLMYLQYVDTRGTIQILKRTSALILDHVSAFVSHTYAPHFLSHTRTHARMWHARQKWRGGVI